MGATSNADIIFVGSSLGALTNSTEKKMGGKH
jgi:hypothetical protein